MIGWIMGGGMHQKSSSFVIYYDGYKHIKSIFVVGVFLMSKMTCGDAIGGGGRLLEVKEMKRD